MVLGSLLAGAVGGATVAIVIRAIDQFSGVFTKAQSGMLALGAGITAIGIAGVGAIGGLTVMAGQFEQTQIAFETMLGSTEKAQELLKDLAEFAAKTPFQIPDVEKNAKLLLAMGIEVENIIPTMKSLGDVAAGLNVPLERIALNFGQVKTQSRLTGRELRDFNIAGVPLLQEIAKNMGLTETAVKELVSAGKIGFADVEKAFKTMSSEGGKFFDLMDAQSKTFLGRVSNIQDSFIILGRIMGEIFLPAARFVAEILEKIVGFMADHPLVAQFAAVMLLLATATALIVGPLILIGILLPFLTAGIATVTAVSLPLILTTLAWVVAFGIAIATIILVIDIIRKLKNNMGEFKVGMAETWNSIVGFFESGANKIVKVLNFLIRQFNKFAPDFLKVGEIGEITLGRIDIREMANQVAKQREVNKETDAFLDAMVKHAEAQELLKIAIKGTNSTLSDQEKLIEKLSGFEFLKTTGDIFNPKNFNRADFDTSFGFKQAKLGAGIEINIDTVQGLDPDEIAKALDELLVSKGF